MICSVKKTKKGSKSLCRIKISFYELKTRIAGTASSTLVQGFSWMSLYFVLVLMAPLQARQSVFFKALFQHKAFHLHSAVQWRMQRCPKYFSSCITFQATCNRCDCSGFVFSLRSLFPVRKVRTHPMCMLTHTNIQSSERIFPPDDAPEKWNAEDLEFCGRIWKEWRDAAPDLRGLGRSIR